MTYTISNLIKKKSNKIFKDTLIIVNYPIYVNHYYLNLLYEIHILIIIMNVILKKGN